MTNRKPQWGAIALAVLCAFAAAGTLVAQTDVTTTRVSGTVTAADGSALPGVTVTGKNLDTGAETISTTDATGAYRLLNLPSGAYQISAGLDGFQTATVESIRLQLGSVPTVNFSLQSSTVSETITVTSETPLVEVTNTSNQTLFETEAIQNLPQFTRDLTKLATLAPQASTEGERRSLALSGQRGINTNITIDGVDYNNSFFGGMTGTAEGRAPLSISQESIKEFAVITNGASVEFGRSGGGFVNVVTKSGTNSIRGSLFYTYQPQDLIADFPNGVEPADQEREQFGGSIGGPIVKDRLFYFVSYDQQDKSITVPIDSRTLDAQVFAQYPELVSPPTYAQTEDGDTLFARTDFLVNDAHRFLVRANFTDYEGINGTSNSPTRAESYNGLEGLDTEAWVGSWSGTFGSSVINDLNVNYIKEDTPREDKSLDLPDFVVTGLGNYGEVAFLPIVSTVKRKAIGDTLSYSHGNHLFKGGFEYNDTSINQIFKGNWRGVFRFNNKTDFLAGRWASYSQFGGLGGLTADEAGRADYGQEETAIFLQDQWFAKSNLTFSFGVRFESLDNPNDPILNQNDRNANGSFNLTGEIPDMDLTDQISPRFGVSWSPSGDDKSAIRFSMGRYWSRTPAILWAQLYTSNGLRGTQYVINAPQTGGVVTGPPTDPLSPGWGDQFTIPGTERIDFQQVPNPSRPGVFALDPDFENPYTDRMSLTYEREVLPYTTVALDLTYAEGNQLQRLTDINLLLDGTTAVNGLPRYSGNTRPNSFYGRITTSISDAESEYKSATVSIRRRLHDGFHYAAQVSWSEDEDNDSNERNFAGIQAEDVNNLDLNWGPSARDQEWRVGVSGLWTTPWWGIELAGAFRYATGVPWNVGSGGDTNNDTNNVDRPTINGVHVGRNSERQPDTFSLDMRLAKTFAIKAVDLSIFAECFNCTDEANQVVPSTNFSWGNPNLPAPSGSGAANFGKDTGINVLIPPRTFQFGLRVDID